ncbi:MAG: potassium transporter Kup [Kofleriaceae bacterium]|nr:potassium transporter Kup [Kofleriaceae bacterium]MBP9167746.1 potassium transporter Kup [Kofleriaceae bacterium]MBP9857757.1 potassium transporter Kup [Kofleriaceae bacterium]
MPAHGHHYHGKKELALVSLGALGVVYGDIGTSPLYAMKECLTGTHGAPPTPGNVFGVLSLVFWALTIVVVIKYLTFVLRADNKGEGGIQALAALVSGATGRSAGRLAIPILMALFGTGLLYGEGVLTPAISVLSAVEGLNVATSKVEHLVVPITIAILVGLFGVQRFGTHRIGAVFGWIMLTWFVSLGAIGISWIVKAPEVLQAVNPIYGAEFLMHNQLKGFLLLGSVVLVITGGEALYADMGHFGRTPIRVAWYCVVFPGLLLNYFGQGALFLTSPVGSITNPFFQMVDGWLTYPLVALATMAAIIASQALISGAFSLTHQAVQLGYAPRVTIVHTSEKAEGQIYIPEINYLLMAACLAVVLGFGSSSKLAGAYGVAVTGTMAITSILYFLVRTKLWHQPMWSSVLMLVVFLGIDLTFFSSTMAKILHGGWLPLTFGAVVFIIMTTWWRGRTELSRLMDQGNLPDALFLDDVETQALHRVKGTAVFMTSNPDGIPNVLMHHVKHNQVLHKQVVLLSIRTEGVPWVPGNTSLSVKDLGQGFYRVEVRVGFMQSPNVPRILQRCEKHGLVAQASTTTYYLGRQTLLTTGRSGIWKWRKMLFAFLTRNARPPTDFFALPPNRVVELGLQIEL